MFEDRVDELSEGSLQMGNGQVSRVVDAVARFSQAVLELRCAPTVPSHTLRADPFRLCSFAELVVHDGDGTFFGGVGRTAYERRVMEAACAQLESDVRALREHCAAYMLLLSSLSEVVCRMMHTSKVIDLRDLVVNPAPTAAYFVTLCLTREYRVVDVSDCVSAATTDDPVVIVGGLATALSGALDNAVERWLRACEEAIAARTLDDAATDRAPCASDAQRASVLRRQLKRVLCDHVAMVGGFRTARLHPVRLVQVAGPLSDEFIHDLLAAQMGGSTTDRCEQRREAQLGALAQLARLLRPPPEEGALDAVRAHGDAILATLSAPPRVLRQRPGFDMCNLEVNKLAMLVRSRGTPELLARQLQVWRRCVGEAALANVLAMVERSVELVRAWAPPETGFLPTMRLIDVPLPTWTDPTEARRGLRDARVGMAMAADADAVSASCLPRAVEAALRLTSLVYEMLGYEPTRSTYFEPGCVRSGFLHDVVINQTVFAEHALHALSVHQQQVTIGANFRLADQQIRDFRSSEHEDALRAAACHLSHVSMGEFLAVASELSPMHHAQRWRIVDRVGSLMGTSEFARFVGRSSAVVSVALEAAMPIVVSMRAEMGLATLARSDPARDFLMSIAALRRRRVEHDGAVVLTHDDLTTTAVPSAVARMQELAARSDGRVVFGRLSRGANAAHGFGARRVWRIDAAFLRSLVGLPVQVLG